MRRPVIASIAIVFALNVVVLAGWLTWPALSEPAVHQPCDDADGEGTWGYDVLGRGWTCAEWNVRFGRFGVRGI